MLILHRFPLFLAQTNRKPLFDIGQSLVIQAYENATVGKHSISGSIDIIVYSQNIIQCMLYPDDNWLSDFLKNWTMFSGSSIAVIRASDQEGDPIVFSLDAVGEELLNIDNNGNLTLEKALDREVSKPLNAWIYLKSRRRIPFSRIINST